MNKLWSKEGIVWWTLSTVLKLSVVKPGLVTSLSSLEWVDSGHCITIHVEICINLYNCIIIWCVARHLWDSAWMFSLYLRYLLIESVLAEWEQAERRVHLLILTVIESQSQSATVSLSQSHLLARDRGLLGCVWQPAPLSLVQECRGSALIGR